MTYELTFLTIVFELFPGRESGESQEHHFHHLTIVVEVTGSLGVYARLFPGQSMAQMLVSETIELGSSEDDWSVVHNAGCS